MKAMVCEKFGPPEVLVQKEVPKPVPKDNEVLINIRASTVNGADCNMRGLSYVPTGLGFMARLMLGIRKPKIAVQGSVISGEVEAVGDKIKSFQSGDRVYGTGPTLGGYAEYACRSTDGAFALIPESISFEEAATIPYGALTALFFLRDKAGVEKGQKVLVVGASGGVGVYAVQLAHYFGAEVTGVCSTRNIEFIKSLGADEVIDYTIEDYAQSGKTWDIIVDIVVGKTSFKRNKKLINRGGYYLPVAGGINDMLNMIWTSIIGSKKVVFGGGADCEKKENLEFLNVLLVSGKLKPVLDRIFPFEELVEAHKYVESGTKRGNIAVIV